MKKIVNLFVLISLFLLGCTPQQDDAIDLPAPPTVAFEVQTTANPNKVKLINKTPDAFLFKWDLGNGSKGDSSVVEAFFPFKGTYKVTLQAFNKGGFGTATKDIVIAQDDPSACSGNLQLLTNCGSKVWKLAPQEGTLKVGPDAAFATVWWQNNAADVVARSCHFNDEYTFTSTGGFEYDNKGDFWADTDGNGNVTPADLGVSPGCQPASAWPTKYKGWSSGSHRFTVNANELTVVGTGAWIGLYKVGTGAEVTTPQASVTYKIKELTANKLVLLANFGPGFWQFTLVPK
jgi:PKD repeat protein